MVHFGAAGENFPVANLTGKPTKCHAEVGLYLGGVKPKFGGKSRHNTLLHLWLRVQGDYRC